MAADIDSQHFFLEGKAQLIGVFAHIGHADLVILFVLFVRDVKEGHLTRHIVFAGCLQIVENAHIDTHHLFSGGAQTVEGAGLDEVLDGAAVDVLFLSCHAGQEIPQVAEGAAQAAFLDDRVDHGAPDALDRGQCVAYAAGGDGEARLALVDIRGKDGDLHRPAGKNIRGDLGRVVDDRGHQGRHKFHWIVILEPGCLVGDDSVTGSMGLVEGVLGKIHHGVVDPGGHLLVDPARGTAGDTFLRISVDEIAALLLHDGLLLFAHGTADQVTPAKGVAAQVADDLHDLLLVDDTAVSRFEDGLQFRAGVVDRAAVVFARYVLRNEVHGTGAVEGDACDDILEVFRPQLFHEILHAAGFQLENTVCPSGGNIAVNIGVGIVESVHGDHRPQRIFRGAGPADGRFGGRVGAAGRFDGVIGHLDGVLYDCESPEAQKVHLEKSQLLDGGHGELSGRRTVLGTGQGDKILRRLRADDDTRRVDGGVPGQALQAQAHVDQLVNAFVSFIGTPEVRALFESLLQGDAQLLGDHLGDGIDIAVGQVHDAADIADDAAGRHGAEGDDLHHPVFAVFFRDIVDDLAPALEPEVHVDIGHGHTLRIEEALKEQVVADGVDVSDPQRIGNNRTCRTPSSGAHHDPVPAGKIDVIPDDEEIVDIAHLADRVQLIFQPGAQVCSGDAGIIRRGVFFVENTGIAFFHTVPAELVEVGPGVIALRHIEAGELGDAELDLHVAAVRDALCIVDGLLNIGKEASHLLFALDIELASGITHTILIGQLFARLDTQKDIVGFRVLCVCVVAVIGGDQRDAHLAAHFQKLRVDSLLVLIAVVLQLEEKIPLSEDIQIAFCRLAGARRISPDDLARHLAGQAGGRSDQPLVKLAQKFQVHTGFVIKPFREGTADDLHEVGVAGIVFRQQDQVIIPVVSVALLPVKARSRRDIDLASDDGIDAGLFCLFIKIDHAVHDAVIGNGRCRHAEFFDPAYVLGDLIGTVQERILRVDVKMRKSHRISCSGKNLLIRNLKTRMFLRVDRFSIFSQYCLNCAGRHLR